MKKYLSFLLLLTSPLGLFAQQFLRGEVFSAKDSTALFGVSVYFDGTSLGVSTDSEGNFELPKKPGITASIIISHIGFEPQSRDPNESGSLGKIYLEETAEQLGEVFLESDTWSRQKKMGVFLGQFLGKRSPALKCKILNDEVLQLRYSPSTETLTAYASEPLIIKNSHLGYRITYTLKEFKVEFTRTKMGFRVPGIVYYEGSSFFEPLRKKTRKKVLRNRLRAYYGSPLHFMRSLAAGQLQEQRYRVFHKSFQVPDYSFFEMKKEESLTRVNVTADTLSLLHRDLEQSALIAQDVFYIDPFGNHSPPDALMLGGDMSLYRVSEQLPLDYWPQED